MANTDPIIKNVAWTGHVFLADMGAGGAFKASPTLAAGDFKVSIDGGAFANLATLPVVDPAAGTAVKIALSATEMNGDEIVVACIDQDATKEWADLGLALKTISGDPFTRLGAPAGASIAADLAEIEAETDGIATLTTTVGTPAGATIAADLAEIEAETDVVTSANAIADAWLDRTDGIETSVTPRQGLRIMLASLAGKLSGAATATVTIRDTNDGKNRIVATVDANGNRSAVVLDPS